MTNAISAPSSTLKALAPFLHYHVAMTQPQTHLFEVTLRIQNWQTTILDLKFPVWTPGSYLVREYAKHLQEFSAQTATGEPLSWRKHSKQHWRVETPGGGEIVVHYRIFAHELTVRTNHLDGSHGYFNPAALCLYLPGFEQTPIQISIQPPDQGWQVTTPLAAVPGELPTFEAADFDTLVDSPFEIGTHRLYEFEVLGKTHQLAIWGEGNADPRQIIQDTQRIIETEAELFGGLPYDRYLFLLHLSSQGYGGLEHRNCCSLNYPRFGFRDRDQYNRFLKLVAHEFFHLWNVKRIRPQALETFDYDGENYTPSLWFSEGTTSFYDQVMPLRAGLYDVKHYLKLVAEAITKLQTTPGRQVQPLSESSFDAWIKLYRPDANSSNSQISYYLKGELVSFLLDLLIRDRHQNQRSLDDVMRCLWQQFGQTETGFTPEALQGVIEEIADQDLGDFFGRYIDGTEELPFAAYLEPFGLQLGAEVKDPGGPYLGLTLQWEQGKSRVKSVISASPAQAAGIDPGDEILALNGFRVTAENWSARLKDHQPGDRVELAVFHQDQLCLRSVTLAAPSPNQFTIQPLENPSDRQRTNFQGWLGTDLDSLSLA
jgi:predicted metalloprotease with PDZ domain